MSDEVGDVIEVDITEWKKLKVCKNCLLIKIVDHEMLVAATNYACMSCVHVQNSPEINVITCLLLNRKIMMYRVHTYIVYWCHKSLLHKPPDCLCRWES